MSTTSSVTSASDIQMDYMKLLITQLQNQNPLEPLENSDMASQLAQFSQLSQLENLNSNFEKALLTAEQDYANSLIGKEVSYLDEQSGTNGLTSGTVQQVVNKDDKLYLIVGENALTLDEILTVTN